MRSVAQAYARDTETRWIDNPVSGLTRMSGLNGSQPQGPTLTAHQLSILHTIALSAASMSMASGLLVGWWFVRMKRSFRHHLIMLMILSDFFKASWQLIYPAVVFARGIVTSTSQFCQAAGFMMSMGIEASDFAVLAIAIHSALYIFRPGMGAIGEGGLYRYRVYVYAAWLAFAVIMPSLAFLNEAPAYTAQGTFCYLPVRPFWYRLALAWIPRYLILLTIITVYAGIYIYVRMRFRTFRTNVGSSTLDVDTVDLAPPEQQRAPQRLPSIDSHGLIPPSPCSVGVLHPSDNSEQPFAKALLAPPNDRTNLSSSSSSPSSSQNCDSRRGSAVFPGGDPSIVGHRTSAEKRRQIKEETANAEARRRRIAISRQLRLLFIYPLVYALMWMPPLFSHALQFTDRFVQHPSFPLQCVVAFTLPFQCFVDCWLFTIREKPWRYIPETQRGNWCARYGFGMKKCKGKSTDIGAEEESDAAWKTRKHLTFEARKAYERRDVEKREAANEWLEKGKRIRMSRRTERSWWDLEQQGIEGEFDDDDDEDSTGPRNESNDFMKNRR